jgi:uncharacterized protein YjbI with pentapeptide repeats
MDSELRRRIEDELRRPLAVPEVEVRDDAGALSDAQLSVLRTLASTSVLLAATYARGVVPSLDRRDAQSLAEEVGARGAPLVAWLRRDVLCIPAIDDPRSLLAATVDDLLGPLRALRGTWGRLAVTADEWTNSSTAGAPGLLVQQIGRSWRSPPGTVSIRVDRPPRTVESFSDEAVALRRWIASRVARTAGDALGAASSVADLLPRLGTDPDAPSADGRVALAALLRERNVVANGIPGYVGPDDWYRGQPSVPFPPTNPGTVDLRGLDLRRADLSVVALAGALLDGARLDEASLPTRDLRGISAVGASMRETNLGAAKLTEAKLDGADLRGARLVGANLARASLRGANLTAAELRIADLGQADLTDARLDGTTLFGADLRGAVLERTSLVGADLEGAKYVEAALVHSVVVGPEPAGLLVAGAARAWLISAIAGPPPPQRRPGARRVAVVEMRTFDGRREVVDARFVLSADGTVETVAPSEHLKRVNDARVERGLPGPGNTMVTRDAGRAFLELLAPNYRGSVHYATRVFEMDEIDAMTPPPYEPPPKLPFE